MSAAAIYVCESHTASCVVTYTHDGFSNECPLCKAEAKIEELKDQVKELEEMAE